MKKIFVFHGVDHKVGTTMVSQSTAEMISGGRKDIRLLLVALCAKTQTEYIRENVETVEGLKLYLDNRVLKREEVVRTSRISENFHMIGGVENFLEERFYYPESAQYLLDTLRDEFDLIIVDAGNDVDNGLAYGALNAADSIRLVLTQGEAALKSYERLRPVYKALNIAADGYVINHYQRSNLPDLPEIAKRISAELETLCKVESAGYGHQAEMDRLTLLAYKNNEYIQDISGLADRILTESGREPLIRQRRGLWKSFI